MTINAILDENRIVGELLVRKGIVTKDQVVSALYIQSEKPHLRIGEILLSMGLISIDELDKILREHLSQQFIGSLLLSNGFMSQEQLAEAMSIQEARGGRLGEIVVERGYVTQFQLDSLLNKQTMLRRPIMVRPAGDSNFEKKTKIVATLGPSSSNDDCVRAMLKSGVNVVRLNFSHGDYAVHQENIERVKSIANEVKEVVAILQDVQGPKLRIGEIEGGEAELVSGKLFRLTTKPQAGNAKQAYVSYEHLLDDIQEGAEVLIDDGRIALVVTGKEKDALVTRVKNGGTLRPRKGVNFPGSALSISSLTAKDQSDIVFGIQHKVDYIAVSFVQTAKDIVGVKDFIKKNGGKTPVIAKIETREAVYNLQEILAVADGVMVARGDLGVEFPAEEVPAIQKQIIRQANIAGRPVITATQMLDSMVSAPRPTRAEASDVANAILDGTDAVMLSNETAAGKYPVEAVATMARIIERTEQTERAVVHKEQESHRQLLEAVTAAACNLASELSAQAIIVPSFSGSTARLVSKFRPNCLIIATASNAAVCRQMALYWGVHPLLVKSGQAEEIGPEVIRRALNQRLLQPAGLYIVMDTVQGSYGRSRGVRVETALPIQNK